MSRPIEELFDELSGPSRPLGPVSGVDWPEPANLRRRAEHRRTVRRASIASSVALVAAVAIAVPATMASHGASTVAPGSHSSTTPSISAKITPKATASPALTAGAPLAEGVTTPTGPRQSFGSFSIVIPTGWSSRVTTDPAVVAPRGTAIHHVCLAPPATAATRSLYGCSGLDIYYDTFLPGQGTAAFPADRTNVASWHHGSAAAICPQTQAQIASGSSILAGPLTGPDQSHYTFPKVGNAKASYQVWHVSCQDGTSFDPQSWYLPDSHAVFFLYDQNREAEADLSTIITTWDTQHG